MEWKELAHAQSRQPTQKHRQPSQISDRHRVHLAHAIGLIDDVVVHGHAAQDRREDESHNVRRVEDVNVRREDLIGREVPKPRQRLICNEKRHEPVRSELKTTMANHPGDAAPNYSTQSGSV